jgi:hypothetical protein
MSLFIQRVEEKTARQRTGGLPTLPYGPGRRRRPIVKEFQNRGLQRNVSFSRIHIFTTNFGFTCTTSLGFPSRVLQENNKISTFAGSICLSLQTALHNPTMSSNE